MEDKWTMRQYLNTSGLIVIFKTIIENLILLKKYKFWKSVIDEYTQNDNTFEYGIFVFQNK